MKKEQIKKIPTKKPASKQGSSLKTGDDTKRYYWIGSAIITLLGFIIYSNSFDCAFQHDDFYNIVSNLSIRDLYDAKVWLNFSPNRPFAVFTFALNYHFSELDVHYWHLVNVSIHIINAFLVWRLILILFSTAAIEKTSIAKHKNAIALTAALLFLTHPLATQSVTYIVQRTASIAAMFYFTSVLFYLKARLLDKQKVKKYLLFGGALLSAILAMLTKENTFTLPLTILLTEFFFIRKKNFTINFRDYRIYAIIGGGIVVIAILMSVIKFSFSVFKPIPPDFGHTYTVTSLNYLFTQFSVILKYIQLLILPVNQMLLYDFPISNNFFEIRTVLSFLLLLALIVIAVILFKKHRLLSFCIFWFFITLSIESSFIPISDLIFEHRTYLPSFGYFLLLSSGVFYLLYDKYKYLTIAIFILIILTNSVLTFERNKVWKTNLSLYNDNIKKAPNIAGPISARADIYAEMGERDKAIADYTRAIEINPNYTAAYSNRGTLYLYYQEWDLAISDLSKAVSINPNYADAYSNRGIVYSKLKEWNKAVADFTKVISIVPDVSNAYFNRGNAYSSMEQWDKAIVDYSKMITLDSTDKRVYAYRGIAYGKLKEWNKAVTDFKKALALDPNYGLAITQLDSANRNISIDSDNNIPGLIK